MVFSHTNPPRCDGSTIPHLPDSTSLRNVYAVATASGRALRQEPGRWGDCSTDFVARLRRCVVTVPPRFSRCTSTNGDAFTDRADSIVVVQLVQDPGELKAQLPAQLATLRDTTEPNTAASDGVPRVVIMGGAFASDIVQACREIRHAESVLWLQDSQTLAEDAARVTNPEELGVSSGVRMKECLMRGSHFVGSMLHPNAGELWEY
jgi:hypothetical protein